MFFFLEELKSQPLISPVPTPPTPTQQKKEEPIIQTEKSVEEIEIDITITNECELELEIVRNEEVIPSEPKYELEVQTQDLDLSPRSEESSSGASKPLLEAPVERQESETKRSGSEERRSSESEPDSEATSVVPDLAGDDDHERKGLFHQGESVEEELPYIPTTLPLERLVCSFYLSLVVFN